jgi:hypothetical protein
MIASVLTDASLLPYFVLTKLKSLIIIIQLTVSDSTTNLPVKSLKLVETSLLTCGIAVTARFSHLHPQPPMRTFQSEICKLPAFLLKKFICKICIATFLKQKICRNYFCPPMESRGRHETLNDIKKTFKACFIPRLCLFNVASSSRQSVIESTPYKAFK